VTRGRPRRGQGVRSRDGRRRDAPRGDLPVVVGRRPSLEAVRSGVAVRLLVASGARRTPALAEVLAAAERASVPVEEVAPDRIEAAAGDVLHQGVAAVVRPARELSEADLERGPWGDRAVVVVLDGVTDPQNLGAIARSAEAAGAEALVTRRARGAGLTPAAVKASAGALLHLPLARVANVARALERLKEAGFWTIGLDGDAEGSLLDLGPPPGRLALVLGSEGEGLSRLVRERCDELARIPMRGRVGSLNVSAAAAVALYATLDPEVPASEEGGRSAVTRGGHRKRGLG
jgi:23S rRNA (guanosine2251-2'-O)-methyltransferase